jgi:hypothetical protein
MFLNIITPCSRPENLKAIKESINIPKRNYRWIVVFDREEIPTDFYLPKNAEYHCYKQWNSCVGHGQRNYGLSLINKGHVYFNDDDTVIHPEFWENIKYCKEMDFISFNQANKDGSMRLNYDTPGVGFVDSHNFIVKAEVAKQKLFEVNLYYADGIYAEECFDISKKILYIPKVLSIYNSLR